MIVIAWVITREHHPLASTPRIAAMICVLASGYLLSGWVIYSGAWFAARSLGSSGYRSFPYSVLAGIFIALVVWVLLVFLAARIASGGRGANARAFGILSLYSTLAVGLSLGVSSLFRDPDGRPRALLALGLTLLSGAVGYTYEIIFRRSHPGPDRTGSR
jgi:hypothetical protein